MKVYVVMEDYEYDIISVCSAIELAQDCVSRGDNRQIFECILDEYADNIRQGKRLYSYHTVGDSCNLTDGECAYNIIWRDGAAIRVWATSEDEARVLAKEAIRKGYTND
jgi:hypothetical protein